MTELPPFLPPDSTPEEVSCWEENFYEIIEDLRLQYDVCDEEGLVGELQKINPSATEMNIAEYTLEVEIGTHFPSPEQVNAIEKGLEGTCFRTDGPDIDWKEVDGIPIGPWKGSIAIIGPPLEGDSFEEMQTCEFWHPWEGAMDRLIELCEENGMPVIYPQDITFGMTIWSGDQMIAGTAITLLEVEDEELE